MLSELAVQPILRVFRQQNMFKLRNYTFVVVSILISTRIVDYVSVLFLQLAQRNVGITTNCLLKLVITD